MKILFDQLADINEAIYRNIIAVTFDEFDDLSPNPKARAYAHKLTSHENNHHAIDFVFKQKSWGQTRYGNGTYPVWYGSLELNTSFYETFYHYYKTFIEAPHGFSTRNHGLFITNRSVFTVSCHAALIDLRHHCAAHRELLNPNDYEFTQSIGLRIHKEGYPGLITKSVRFASGNSLAIFNKNVLSSPKPHGNFRYEYDPANQTVNVINHDINQSVQIFNYNF